MTDQSDPVSGDEYILRRVPHIPQNPWIFPDSPQPVDKLAFRPTDDDEGGISVFRELFVSAEEIAARNREGKGKECWVLRIRVSDLLGFPISVEVVPDPLEGDGLPGHSLIPQLNTDLRKNNRRTCGDLQQRIASVLTNDDIVSQPGAGDGS